MGLPMDWGRTERWLKKSVSTFIPAEPLTVENPRKCPEIPTLQDYKSPAGSEFWKCFPYNPLPAFPTSPVDSVALEQAGLALKHKMADSQQRRLRTVVSELKEGVSVPFKNELPAIRIPNTSSVTEHGAAFTDILGSWIKKKIVAGPFPIPPFPDIRTNSMIAVPQKNKVRMVMNMSGPKDFSFNDAIDEERLEQVHMSTARKYGYSVIDCGSGALMYKWDQEDAYKNMPAKLQDLRLQGFTWLGYYFIETQQVFGSKAAVAAFDRLAKTLADLAAIESHLPAHLIHRTLDDLPIVVPGQSTMGDRFASAYKHLCKKVGVTLAPNCEKSVKAFEGVTVGTVLGVRFDTNNLTWSISLDKRVKLLNRISSPMQGRPMSLHDTQELIGSLNDFGQMCQFLRAFRLPLQLFLAAFNGQEDILLTPPMEVRADLRIWAAAVEDAGNGLPIPHRMPNFHNCELVFVSDASGAQFTKIGGRFVPYGPTQERGAASINCIDSDNLWFCTVLYWPDELLFRARDTKDHAYGCKTATLEVIALILPLLSIPHQFVGKKALFLTDNISVVYGWDSKKITNDVSASIFLRAIHIISFYLGCFIQIEHLPRNSTPSAELADSLTRKSTSTAAIQQRIKGVVSYDIPTVLTKWIENPVEDWDYALELLEFVKNKTHM